MSGYLRPLLFPEQAYSASVASRPCTGSIEELQ